MNLFSRNLAFAAAAAGLLCAAPPAAGQESLNITLKPYLEQGDLPALAAAVVKEGKVVAVGAVGTRRAGADIPVELDDRFHLGSDTKAMTSLLAAMLVEKNKLQWNSTLSDLFPELTAQMHADIRKVTVEQLASHTSGLEGDNDQTQKLLDGSYKQPGNLDEQRYWILKQRVPLALDHPPGKFVYSNLGYTILGAIIERLEGKTWEELITEKIFKPLNLRTAGLGIQSSVGRVDAPLSHVIIDGKPKALLAGPNSDNPLVLGPAGTAHMSISDFARWAGWNAGGGKRGPQLVSSESLRKMHTPVVEMDPPKNPAPGTPPGGEYGLGWGQLKLPWAPRPLLFHGGSNDMNLAFIIIDQEADLAIVTTTNISGEKADAALKNLAKQLYTRHSTPQLN